MSPGATLVPAARYTSPAWLAREIESVFHDVWLLAVHVSELTTTGEFRIFEIAGESILIARAEDGSLRAHYNVCQHRGALLCAEMRGKATTFRCSYHHWEYALDGRLIRAPGAGLAASTPDGRPVTLAPVACAERFGFVWVSLATSPVSIDDYLAPIADYLSLYRLEEYRLATENIVDVAANWKASVDVNNEDYHLGSLHPGLLDVADERDIDEQVCGPHTTISLALGRPSHSFPAGAPASEALHGLLRALGVDDFPADGRTEDVRPAIARSYRARAARSGIDLHAFSDEVLARKQQVHVFPNVQLNLQPFRLELYRHRPHPTDPSRCWFDELSFVRGSRHTEPQRRRFRHGEHHLGAVLDADIDMLPRLQAGMRSRGFSALRLTHRERCIAHMHETLGRYLSAKDGE